MICPHGHDEAMIERLATPEEVDAGCELGVAYDPCPDCQTADKQELAWWRDFALKITADSNMPRVGSPLLGHRYRVQLDLPANKQHHVERFGSRFPR